MPAFNELANLRRTVPEYLERLDSLAREHELLVVLDGRTRDESREYLLDLPGVRLIEQSGDDPGYGRALALGWAAARGELVFYTDCDGQYALDDLPRFLEAARKADFVAGYRERRRDPGARIATAWFYNRLIRILFGLRIRDVDCSFKLIRKEALKCMAFTCQTGAVEVELFLQARAAGLKTVEIPVRHFPRREGTSAFDRGRLALPAAGNVLAVFRELLRLKRTACPRPSKPDRIPA